MAATRRLLGDLRDVLARAGPAAQPRLATLRQALADLDYLFLLVVAGEFNAGKSALINALLGADILDEGVTPTTAAITLLTYGERPERVDRSDGLLEQRYPLPLLREVALVDTPGTNAVLREHERLTRELVPRSDLLLFVTSADRPFTESERAFLEQVRTWGKKIVVVLNKVDLLAGPPELETQLKFIRESAQRLLGLDPPIWPVSARQARAAEREADPERAEALRQASGLGALREYLETTLADQTRVQLKLLSAVGVGERLLAEERQLVEGRLTTLHDDRQAREVIERRLLDHAAEQRRDFEPRLDRLDNLLLEMQARADRFFDDTVRLTRVMDLLNADKLRTDFERDVIADVPTRLEEQGERLFDWLVDRDRQFWLWLGQEVQRRAEHAAGAGGPVQTADGAFSEDRAAMLTGLQRTTRDVLRRHDQRAESERLAESVRDAVTRTALVEVGAVGLGAATVAIVGSAAADVTGILAATVLAGLGFYLLPLRRRRAKAEFRERTDALRQTLRGALQQELEGYVGGSLTRARTALAPYDRFVESEQGRLEALNVELNRLADDFRALRRGVENGDQPAAPASPAQPERQA